MKSVFGRIVMAFPEDGGPPRNMESREQTGEANIVSYHFN